MAYPFYIWYSLPKLLKFDYARVDVAVPHPRGDQADVVECLSIYAEERLYEGVSQLPPHKSLLLEQLCHTLVMVDAGSLPTTNQLLVDISSVQSAKSFQRDLFPLIRPAKYVGIASS